MRYQHDCEHCVPLGEHEGADLYFCERTVRPTLIARFGDDGPDYVSTSESNSSNRHLAVARRLAQERGLLRGRDDEPKGETMNDFEKSVKAAAEKAVLKFIEDGGWLMSAYESRLKVPDEWIAECWRLVNTESLKQKIADRLESELADRMVNHMATELATDIKQILSVRERREMLRSLAREHMDVVMRAGNG